MSFITKNLQKSKRRSLGEGGDNFLSPVERKSSSKSIGDHSDEHLSQSSSDLNKKKKTSRRVSTELPHLDSFKHMFSIASPRSTGSRSPGRQKSPRSHSSDSKSNHSPRSPTTIMGRMKQIAIRSKDATKDKSFQNEVEEAEETESLKFEHAITIIGCERTLKKFHEVFTFLHRLDALEIEDEDEEKNKFGLLHEITVKSKSQSVKVQITRVSSTEHLHDISTKFHSAAHHSYIVLCDEETDDVMETWFNIIESIGLTGNIILLFDESNEGDGLDILMKKMEDKVSDIFIEAFVKSLSVDYSNPDTKLEQIEDCIQKSLI